ncbi:HalOD1 output domain-containing protein [Halobellus rarus]|uniref:HalOD1 output domain-containing protein n=1 Tax=Halobellus rarus TaxID=1126237 RepID=A0ABD6CQ84_9EURY|nr:HalOD1 output domain-containing protein [Halobellus rarus]
MAANSKIAESLSPIESDAESRSFQATYDSTRDSTSLAIVAVVATALGEDPQALTPLQTAIDTDALDKLVTESDTGLGTCGSISFRYDGFKITATSEGVIEANPIEDIQSAPMHPYRIECAGCGQPRLGKKRAPDTAVVPYQDTCPECECDSFDIGVTT